MPPIAPLREFSSHLRLWRIQDFTDAFSYTLHPDLAVTHAALTLETVSHLERLAPFGQHNPEPLLFSAGLAVRNSRTVGSTHLKLTLGDGGLDAIGFGLGHLAAELPPAVDVIYRLERNVFRGRVTAQLNIEDIRPAQSA